MSAGIKEEQKQRKELSSSMTVDWIPPTRGVGKIRQTMVNNQTAPVHPSLRFDRSDSRELTVSAPW